ncbi:MAG: hypothetical protein QM753_08810 [Thermomicrobiales bacterium]
MPKLWPFGTKQDTVRVTIETSGFDDRSYLPPWGAGMQPDLKKHFELVERLRAAPASKQEATAQAMVQMAPQAIRGFRADYEHRKDQHARSKWYGSGKKPPMEPFKLPNHPGFQRLAINAEKAKDYGRAIGVCEEAKRQGWNGDWDKRIERCRVRAGKG